MSFTRPMLAGRLLMVLATLVLPLGGRTPGPRASQRPAGESTVAQLAGARPLGPSTIPSDVEAWIDREFIATHAASLTMAVAREGRILWARSWGWADREQHVRATPQTPYILASVSKSITATALLTLVERGTINLDAPIETYLDGLTLRAYGGPARDATVRRVLSHTAGLPSFQNVFFADESRRFHLSRTNADRLAGPVSAWTFRSGRGADILPAYAVLHRKGASTGAADAR